MKMNQNNSNSNNYKNKMNIGKKILNLLEKA